MSESTLRSTPDYFSPDEIRLMQDNLDSYTPEEQDERYVILFPHQSTKVFSPRLSWQWIQSQQGVGTRMWVGIIMRVA